MDYKIRTISEGEESLLQDFLYQAVFVPEGVPARHGTKTAWYKKS